MYDSLVTRHGLPRMEGGTDPSAQSGLPGNETMCSVAPRSSRRQAVDGDRYNDLAHVICLTTATSVSPKIRRAVRYLDKNFPHKLTLRSVGRHIAYHPNYLCRKFREELGVSFTEYLVRIRLQKAIRWLAYTDDPIKAIGYRAGFGRPERFSKVFRQWVQCSPREFRTRYRYGEIGSQGGTSCG